MVVAVPPRTLSNPGTAPRITLLAQMIRLDIPVEGRLGKWSARHQ